MCLLTSKDFEYHRMDVVVHELSESMRKNADDWELDIHEPIHNSESFSHNHILILRHKSTQQEFLISENPLHFNVDMSRVFDVLVNDLPNERYLTQVFSEAQRYRLYDDFNREFKVVTFINEYVDKHDLELRPFKNPQQRVLFDHFLDGKEWKYPTLKLNKIA